MGYRIEYQTVHKKSANLYNCMRLPMLTLLCFVLFVFLVKSMWPEGAALMQKLAVYPKRVIAASALDDFANELHYGEALINAFSEFCRKLIS